MYPPLKGVGLQMNLDRVSSPGVNDPCHRHKPSAQFRGSARMPLLPCLHRNQQQSIADFPVGGL
jgi:hypothetical protein